MLNRQPAVEGKDRVLDFINSVDKEKENEAKMNAFRHSDVYKRNFMDRECEKGKEECLKHIVQTCYKNATPLSDEYKDAFYNDFSDCIDKHCPDGLLFYFREGIRKGTCGERCKKMVEAVCKEMDQAYCDMRACPEKYDENDLVFRMDPEMQTRMDLLSKDLELDDISELINQSVKSSAESEIRRAKEEKEKAKELEKELANDMSVTSESAIERELDLRNLRQPKFFQPTLFQGIMIDFTEQADSLPMDSYTYHALEAYGMDGEENSPMYTAFVETVKEYTWNVFEDAFLHKSKRSVMDNKRLALEYASGKRR